MQGIYSDIMRFFLWTELETFAVISLMYWLYFDIDTNVSSWYKSLIVRELVRLYCKMQV